MLKLKKRYVYKADLEHVLRWSKLLSKNGFEYDVKIVFKDDGEIDHYRMTFWMTQDEHELLVNYAF